MSVQIDVMQHVQLKTNLLLKDSINIFIKNLLIDETALMPFKKCLILNMGLNLS